MVNYRRLSAAIGIAALGAGAVGIVSPETLPLSPGRVVLSLIGVLALFRALRAIQRRRNSSLDEATTPEPERAAPTPTPGDDFESVLAEFTGRRRTFGRLRRVEGLSAAAIAVLVRFGGYTESEARERLEAGTWTDDVYAASYLGGGDAPSVPLRARLRDSLRPASSTRRRVRRTVDAIAAVADGRPGSDEPDAPFADVRDGRTGASGSSDPSDSRGTPPRRRTSTTDAYAFDEDTDEVLSRGAHSTGHWRGVDVVALLGIGVGVLVEQPAVLLAGVVGIGYAAYARSPAFPPGSVRIDRTLEDDAPSAGEAVTVTVTVTNAGDRFLPDLRIVDGVPEALSVEDGSPRCGAALRPGEQVTFSYAVTARRGVHAFGPTHVIGRNLAGTIEAERLYATETPLECLPPLSACDEPVPLRQTGSRFAGREAARTTGEGIEFSSTREYRPEDPMRRIDWNRRARSRELTTIEFREERAATVVLLVDARPSAYVSPDASGEHAVDRAVEAAGRLFARLDGTGNRVGIAAAGSGACWLAPNAGVEHRTAARKLLAVDPALSPVPKAEHERAWNWQKTLRKRLEPGTQIVFLTPLCAEDTGRIARRFDERGYPVTVVSPDSTSDGSAGHRFARIARELRVSTLRSAGIPVVDWAWEEPLEAALARYGERRSP